MQKFESTRNKTGMRYSSDTNEFKFWEVFDSKFHNSVVALKMWLSDRLLGFQKRTVTRSTKPRRLEGDKHHLTTKSFALHFFARKLPLFASCAVTWHDSIKAKQCNLLLSVYWGDRNVSCLFRLSWINSLTFHSQPYRQRSNILRREILQNDHSFLRSNHQSWAICCFYIEQWLMLY